MRYLVLTLNTGIWYLKGSGFKLIEYLDVNYDGCKVDKNVPPGLTNFLVGPLYLGPQRNKILLPYPWPKQSTLMSVVVVHNYY
jgi:hypothetical protein